jgi:hypothetical protein
MAVGSRYLLKPLRTLREACAEIRSAHPELMAGGCAGCPHGRLCERLERLHRAQDENVKAKPPRKQAARRSR